MLKDTTVTSVKMAPLIWIVLMSRGVCLVLVMAERVVVNQLVDLLHQPY